MSATNAMQALEGHAIYDGGYNRVSPSASPQLLEQEIKLFPCILQSLKDYI